MNIGWGREELENLPFPWIDTGFQRLVNLHVLELEGRSGRACWALKIENYDSYICSPVRVHSRKLDCCEWFFNQLCSQDTSDILVYISLCRSGILAGSSFSFGGIFVLFSIIYVLIYIPVNTTCVQGFVCSTSCFYGSYSNRYVRYLIFIFIYISQWSMVLNIFGIPVGCWDIFFWNTPIQIFCLFKNWVIFLLLSCLNPLCILGINCLSGL